MVAQKLVNEDDPRKTALLWERNGYSYETLERGLHIPATLHRIFPRATLESPTPNTHYIPTLIPDVFLECGERPLRLRPRRAVFLGRYSRSKGALEAARFWEESISGWSGDSLYMLGLGLDDSDAKLQVKSVAERCPQVRLDHLPDEDERAGFLSSCRIGLFLGTQDFYPQALLESMAAGLLAIATPIAGYAPAVEDGRAIQVSGRNHLVAETRRVLSRPSHKDEIMAQKGRDYVRRFHGREVVWQHFHRFLRSFL